MGGTLYETSNVALPLAVRESKLYQVTLDRLLRIVIEWVGDVRGIYRMRRPACRSWPRASSPGICVEFASIFAVGFSPLWILAAASDVMGGSKAYLRALVAELQAADNCPPARDVASYEDLLNRLETGSGVLADTIDMPPMTVKDARASFEALRRQASDLPSPEELAEIFREMQTTAQARGALAVRCFRRRRRWPRRGPGSGSAMPTSLISTAQRSARFSKKGCCAFCAGRRPRTVTRAGDTSDPRAGTYTERFLRLSGAASRRISRLKQPDCSNRS